MKSAETDLDLHACESIVINQYDEDFAALYRCVWDSYLGNRQEGLLNDLFPDDSTPSTILDAAAGTGELAVRLVKSGRKVTANELSPSMRRYIHKRKAATTPTNGALAVLEPGICWRNLPDKIGKQSFGLVICIGAALAHCDNSRTGILNDSLVALASLVESNGFLLVDCKRYAEDGRELQGDGSKRPLEIADSEDVEWIDLRGNHRKGTLRSSFSISADSTLTRVFHYQEIAAANRCEREWTFRTWPVAKLEVCGILESYGMRLVREKVLGGTGNKLPVDNLLFRKGPPQ
jgi:SAM-dependent methyltransferase